MKIRDLTSKVNLECKKVLLIQSKMMKNIAQINMKANIPSRIIKNNKNLQASMTTFVQI